MFLSVAAVAAFPRFPSKSTGRPILGLSQGANFPHGLAGRSPSSVGFSFHFALGREATPDLLLPLKRRRFRRPSPHRRVAGPFRLWLIGTAYRPSDGGGLHRSWHGTIFSRRRHASPDWSPAGNPLNRLWGREVRALVSASSKGGEWHTKQAENAVSRSHLAWPLRHAAFSGKPGGDALAAYLRGSCGVRARRSVRVRSRTGRLRRSVLSSFHRLTLSSRGKLSPEPLRLTRPVGADVHRR